MLELLLSSSVLIVILALLRVILRGRIRARVQYALWGLVALRLLLPVTLFSAPVSASTVTEPVEQQIELYSHERTVTVEYPVSMGRSPETGEAVTAIARTYVEPLDVLRWAWYGGMVVTGAWFCYVNLRAAIRLRRGREAVTMDAPVPVYVSRDIESPCLFGILRPAVYLTEQALSNGEQARMVMAHELTHWRQGDCVWALVRGVCLVVWWFDPLVWLAAALSRRDCELACDEGTVIALGEAQRYDYGRTLLALATVKPGAAALLCGATTMTGGKSALAERIRSLAKPGRSTALCIVALSLGVLAAGCAFSGTPQPEVEAGPTPLPTPTPILAEQTSEPAPTPQPEEELGSYSDELWRIFNELDEFSCAQQVTLSYRDESVAEAYRSACDPAAVLGFSSISHCTDSWTAEYDIAAELAEPSDAQITIASYTGDRLYIRSDTDNIYVSRADGTIDRYTGPSSQFMLEHMWYWAEAMTAPLEEVPLTLALDETRALSDILSNENAVYWYSSDWSVAEIWVGEGDKSRAAGYPDVENGALMACSEGMCFVGCTDAEGHALERRMVLVSGQEQ